MQNNRLLLLVALAFIAQVSAATAAQSNAYTMFPPDNCQANTPMIMTWDKASNVKCNTLSSLLAVPDCVSGQVLTVQNGVFQCVGQPACSTQVVKNSACPAVQYGQAVGSVQTTQQVCNGVPTGPQTVVDSCYCVGTTTSTTSACPDSAQQGSVYHYTQTDCSGNVTTFDETECSVAIQETQTTSCIPGSTYSGTMTNGVFSPCGAGQTNCSIYTCTDSGLQ